MPHPCVVCGRSRMNPNNREEEYMFFGFPVNDDVRCKKWLEFCCREDLYKLTKKQLLQRMVCSKHFETKDFLNEYFDRLNCAAVPSIYDPKQSLYNITCVMCGRSRRDPPGFDYDGVTFHHFPGEEFRCLKWLDFVGVDSYYRLTRKEILFCYICSKHFDTSQFTPSYKNRLIDNAVPNIRHPDQLDVSEQYMMEFVSEQKPYTPEKPKKVDPLPTAVLESQACAACGRLRSDPRNKSERYKFHPFPAYEIGRCLRWCQFLGREDLLKMSPNQIRKLVLCSKHFQTGQNFHKVGPCDAVPTIKDISQLSSVTPAEQVVEEQEVLDESNCPSTGKVIKKPGFIRPLVSSKKPKIDNKPAPLAKKRGKSKRPTLIKVPRVDHNNIENHMIRKLPLPPNSTWKIQLPDQYQPITIANNVIPNAVNNIPGSIKKVILPFTGDISNLGAPIPVNSLSSIPPGLLIKINLPEQEQQKPKVSKKPPKPKPVQQHIVPSSDQIWINNSQAVTLPVVNPVKPDAEKTLVEILSMPAEAEKPASEEVEVERTITNDLNMQEDVEMHNTLEIMDNEAVIIKEEFYEEFEEIECLPPKKHKPLKRRKVPGTTRRTMFPIRNEVRCFLTKLAPLMHRLPKKTRAQIKLSIVNMDPTLAMCLAKCIECARILDNIGFIRGTSFAVNIGVSRDTK